MTSKIKRPASATSIVVTPSVMTTLAALGASVDVTAVVSFVVGALPLAVSVLVDNKGIRGVARMLWAGRG